MGSYLASTGIIELRLQVVGIRQIQLNIAGNNYNTNAGSALAYA